MTDAATANGMPASDSTEPELSVRDVSVHVRSRTLLQGVSFEARLGEVTVIIGPNGAGKTTLLEIVTGLREATSGAVALRGRTLRHFSERASHIAFLPDKGELPAELRAGDVVDHALRHRARPPGLVGELREALAIGSLFDAPVGVLSRGEHQRLALFCALAIERSVVVLDEPFEAFDPLKLRDVLRAVRKVADSGAAVVATVHHLADAARTADRILILSEGRAVAWGAIDALRDKAGLPDGSLEGVFIALLSGSADAA